MDRLPFVKMHGLGNDFVVLDARGRGLALGPAQVRAIADRHRGVGCDQLILVEDPTETLADAFMRIYNPDGSEAGACGNATRCVARMVMGERGRDHAVVQTVAGLLDAEAAGERIAVDMGPALLDWRDVPLAEAMDTLHVPVAIGPLADGVACSMGNPHVTFFVPDAEVVAVGEFGPLVERHRLFPDRANVGIAQLAGPDRLRLRMWERGAGVTLACGSGACAAGVAAARRGLTARRVEVLLDGGTLDIDWMADGHVMMTGPTAVSFCGTLDPSLLAVTA